MAQYVVHTTEGRKRKTIYGKTRAEVAKKLSQALSVREKGVIFEPAPSPVPAPVTSKPRLRESR